MCSVREIRDLADTNAWLSTGSSTLLFFKSRGFALARWACVGRGAVEQLVLQSRRSRRWALVWQRVVVGVA
jgi:hypothetical protein